MTFKDLQKIVQSQSGPDQSQLLQRLRDKPFWIWKPKQHKTEDIRNKGDCCFNHIIGLPRKDGIEKSIFDYENLLYDSRLITDFYNPSKHNFKHKTFVGKESNWTWSYRICEDEQRGISSYNHA
ncbi:hypothetical protein BH18THE2_BH18THE2_32060 [soil metagenome]